VVKKVCFAFLFKTLEFREMLDLVCNDALAILFMFDLSRKATLHSVKEWYMQSRKFNKKGKFKRKLKPQAIPFLVGTKFDKFLELSESEQTDITIQARKFAGIMKAPIIFCSGRNYKNFNFLSCCWHQHQENLQTCCFQGF
jgi:GTPase SAR1 family protein